MRRRADRGDHGEIAKVLQLVHCVAEQIVVFQRHRSWEIEKVLQLVHCVAEQIVVFQCHRSWGNREGFTARALRRRADRARRSALRSLTMARAGWWERSVLHGHVPEHHDEK